MQWPAINKNGLKEKKEHLLVIRLSAMGDCALAVPVLRALQEQHPTVKFTVVTKPFFKNIFGLLEGVEVVEADTKAEYKGFFGVLKLGKQLSGEGFTKVADLHDVLRSKIVRKIFALHQIPSVKIDKGRADKKALTQLEKKELQPLQTTSERYADVFRRLGFPLHLGDNNFLNPLKLSSTAGKMLPESSFKIVGIAPFAAHEAKTYPVDLMKQIIGKLDAQENCRILLFGGGEEVEQLSALEAGFKNTVSVAGKLSFKEELQVISHLDVMLSMDSGNGHLAAMFGVPVITLWGGTHPYAGFAPYGQSEENQILPDLEKYPFLPTSVFGNKMIPGYEEVMRTILPETVINRIHEILEGTKE